MKKLTEITSKDWSDLFVFIHKKVYGNTEYPHPPGLGFYFDEVIGTLESLRTNTNKKNHRLSLCISEEYLPYFVVKWLNEHGYLIGL